MGRRGLRENIFKLLFMSEFHQPEELEDQVCVYLEELESLEEQDSDYMQKKYASIREHISEIDSMLNEISRGWKTSRMSRVDLNILRLAVYEIYHDEDVPEKVAANEAVEIAKKYGGEESASFINGLLGKVIRTKGEQCS